MKAIKLTKITPFLVILFLLSSCIKDNFDNNNPSNIKSGYMKIAFTLPDFSDLVESGNQTRAMDNSAERAIDIKKFSILIFDNTTDRFFEYKAPIVDNSLQIDPEDPTRAVVTIKLVKSDKPINILVVANHIVPSENLTEGETKWEDFIKTLEYEMPTAMDGNNIWLAEAANFIPFPMSGSIKVNRVDENMGTYSVNLRRALARVDIGLNFQITPGEGQNGVKYTELAQGLSNFELEKVLVYRTFEKGYVASLNGDEANPSIPADGIRREDHSPLQYDVPLGENAYVREIYLPESYGDSQVSANSLNDSIHTLVIGGSFEGGPTTFYRLDFAQDAMNQDRTYFSILRNYRYLFNILKVNAPGFNTAREALLSTPNTNLQYQLVVWDESIHEMHIHGQHFFGLDNRKITFSSRLDEVNSINNTIKLKYQTNYPLSATDRITFEWENPIDESDLSRSPDFEVTWNEITEEIEITKKRTNITNTVISDLLHVKVGQFDISVEVNQNYLDFKYLLVCESVELSGIYKPYIALDGNKHTITLKFIAESTDLVGLNYDIYTPMVNGIQFRASGIITADALEVNGGQEVILRGEGTLTPPSTEERVSPFTVRIESNSSSKSFCEVTITPVLGKINLITHGASKNTYGYNLSGDTPVNAVLTALSNYGPNDNSRIKIEGFNIIDGANPTGRTGMSDEVKLWLTGKKKVVDPDTGVEHNVIADIYHMGFSSDLAETDIPILLDFMKNGGVLILFMENNSPLPLFKKVYNNENLSMGYTAGSKAVPIVGNDAFRIQQNKNDIEWDGVLNSLRVDPILNGPFGDVVDKQWGEDASSYFYVDNIPDNEENTTVYSRNYTLTWNRELSSGTEAASAFKYESTIYNLVFVGDGGFNSQNGGRAEMGDSYPNLCPFFYDVTTLFPLPKSHYNPGSRDDRIPVYNSQMFCNIFAWAVNKANSLEMREKKDQVIQEAQNGI